MMELKQLPGKLMRKIIKSAKKYTNKEMDYQLIPLIANCIQEAIRELEEKEEETKSEGAQDPLKILKFNLLRKKSLKKNI